MAASMRLGLAVPACAGLQSFPARRATRSVVARASLDTNLFVNLILSGACGAAATAVTVYTSENRDAEIQRIQTVEGALPVAGALFLDAAMHSVPGLNALFQLLAEPAGAACGVSYMMLLLLSSKAVDPNTLAPKGTVLAAEKAADNRALARVPFFQIIPTALKVTDFSNSGFSGAGWEVAEDGLPRLPVTSVAIVVGVGALILEAASHAPVLTVFMPRVLTCAFCLAAVGAVLDRRDRK